jgi:ATP-dependent DNA helicase RecG
LEPHASCPFNPDIANAFFRAGEIEAWGRGIERIFAACREAGNPTPRFRFDGTGLWAEFPCPADYVQALRSEAGAAKGGSRFGEVELEVVKNKHGDLGSAKAAYIENQHRVENLAMVVEYTSA